MEVREKVYCTLYDWELKQVDEMLTGISQALVKKVQTFAEEKIQEAFDKGRKYEQEKNENIKACK